MIRLLPRIITGIKTRMTNISSVFYTNDILVRESEFGDSYIEKALENSPLTVCKG